MSTGVSLRVPLRSNLVYGACRLELSLRGDRAHGVRGGSCIERAASAVYWLWFPRPTQLLRLASFVPSMINTYLSGAVLFVAAANSLVTQHGGPLGRQGLSPQIPGFPGRHPMFTGKLCP